MSKAIRNQKNSVAAFSIVETLVGMAITAIIMGILFAIFSIVTERMIDFKNQNQLVNDLNRFTYSINKDIFEKEKMIKTDNTIVFKGYAGEQVLYRFENDFTTRTNETFVDTFQIKLKQIVIDTVRNKSQRLLFQKLKLNIETNENQTVLNFYKRVYANELLQKMPK
ncbi:PulJ/GspJ family protein [Flavobacterium sp. 3-210]